MQSEAHPEGTCIAASIGSGSQLFSVRESNSEEKLPQKHEEDVKTKQTRAKGKQAGSDDGGSAELSVVETSTVPTQLEGNQKVVRFACGGEKLLTGGEDREIKVWKVRSERGS